MIKIPQLCSKIPFDIHPVHPGRFSEAATGNVL